MAQSALPVFPIKFNAVTEKLHSRSTLKEDAAVVGMPITLRSFRLTQ